MFPKNRDRLSIKYSVHTWDKNKQQQPTARKEKTKYI